MFPAPYTYDDPRLLYNEPCFFYDGGFDQVCLINKFQIRTGGRSSASRNKENKPLDDKEYINVFIECELKHVNGDRFISKEGKKILRFVGENSKYNIFLKNTKINFNKPIVKGEYIKLIKDLSVSSSLDNIKTKKEDEKVKIKTHQIEPYENIKISTVFVDIKQKKDNE